MEIFIKSIIYTSIFIVLLKLTILENQNRGLGETVVKNINSIKIFGKNKDWIDKNEIRFLRLIAAGIGFGLISFIVDIIWD